MLKVHETRLGKIRGSSPAEDRYYVVVLFDISNQKKYRRIIKILNGYGDRIQYSIFEAYLRSAQIKEMVQKTRDVMANERYYDPKDKIRIYRVAGNCDLTIFCDYVEPAPMGDVFI